MTSEPVDADARDDGAFVTETRQRAQMLKLDQVRRAIVIDFEGPGRRAKGKPPSRPSLLGVLTPQGTRPSNYSVYVCDERLALLTRAETGEWKAAHLLALPDALHRVLELAQEGAPRHVMWFSRHESALIAPLLRAHAELAPLRALCVDAKGLMDPLAGRGLLKADDDDGLALTTCATEFGFGDQVVRQDDLGVKPATVIRELAAACAKVRRLQKLSQPARDKAERLLEYNRIDCELTRECAMKAWSVLRAARRQRSKSKPNERSAQTSRSAVP